MSDRNSFCKVLQRWAKAEAFSSTEWNCTKRFWTGKKSKAPRVLFLCANLISHEILERQQQQANKVHLIQSVLAWCFAFAVAAGGCNEVPRWYLLVLFTAHSPAAYFSGLSWQSALASHQERERGRKSSRVTCSREEIGLWRWWFAAPGCLAGLPNLLCAT